jgi:general secretion pathway protein A
MPSARPFDFLWLGPEQRDVLARLKAAVLHGGGLLTLTGELGVGKTVLTKALVADLAGQVRVATTLYPKFTPRDLCELLAGAFGFDAGDCSRAALTRGVEHALADAATGGGPLLLVVDEAQSLEPEAIEELAHLLALASAFPPPRFSVLLAGQDELDALVADPGSPLARHVTLACRVPPIAAHEIPEYVTHRLTVAGADPARVTAGGLRAIGTASAGIPRVINLLCELAVLETSPARVVDERAVRERARHFGIDAEPERNRAHPPWRTPSAPGRARAGDDGGLAAERRSRRPRARWGVAAVFVALIGAASLSAVLAGGDLWRVVPFATVGAVARPEPVPDVRPPARVDAVVVERSEAPAPREVLDVPEPAGPSVATQNGAAEAASPPALPASVAAPPASAGSRATPRARAPEERPAVVPVRRAATPTRVERDAVETVATRARVPEPEPSVSWQPGGGSSDRPDAPDPGAIIDWLMKEGSGRR